MQGIARLLFGEEAGGLLDLFDGAGGDEFGMAERARRAGEWCGTTPGRGSAASAVRVARPRGTRRPVVTREFRDR